MNKGDIISYFGRLDEGLAAPTVLHIYGSAAVILLGADERTSLDIDVAGPYSTADYARFEKASAASCPRHRIAAVGAALSGIPV